MSLTQSNGIFVLIFLNFLLFFHVSFTSDIYLSTNLNKNYLDAHTSNYILCIIGWEGTNLVEPIPEYSTGWKSPPLGVLKDARCFEDGHTCWGLIVRNHEGAVITAKRKIENVSMTPILAEVVGLWWCFKLAFRKKRKLILSIWILGGLLRLSMQCNITNVYVIHVNEWKQEHQFVCFKFSYF